MTIISYSKSFKKSNIFEFSHSKTNSKIAKKRKLKASKTFLVLGSLVFLVFAASYIYMVNLQTAFNIKNRENLKKIELVKEKNNLLEAKLSTLTSLKKFKEVAQNYNLEICSSPEYLKDLAAR